MESQTLFNKLSNSTSFEKKLTLPFLLNFAMVFKILSICFKLGAVKSGTLNFFSLMSENGLRVLSSYISWFISWKQEMKICEFSKLEHCAVNKPTNAHTQPTRGSRSSALSLKLLILKERRSCL